MSIATSCYFACSKNTVLEMSRGLDLLKCIMRPCSHHGTDGAHSSLQHSFFECCGRPRCGILFGEFGIVFILELPLEPLHVLGLQHSGELV